MGVSLITNGAMVSDIELCLESPNSSVSVCVRVDFLSVYTTNQGTKTGFNYVIYREEQLQLSLPQKCKERKFRFKLFPIRQS